MDTDKTTARTLIARCPEHGLHGERTECFECGGPVEQVAMVPLTDALRSLIDVPTAPRTHRVETYQPRPRPAGETEARIAAAIFQPAAPL